MALIAEPCSTVPARWSGTIIKSLEFDPLGSELIREHGGQRVLEITREVVDALRPG
jgi:hypothetical protein